jgi:hypothetical protein
LLPSIASAQQAAAGAKTLTFDNDPLGSQPAGFEFARTGQGTEGKWVVRADKDSPDNHLLVQESPDPTDNRFPLAVVKEASYRDVTLSVRARPVSGEVDQGFGMVWRYKDADNSTSRAATPMRTTARSTTPSPAAGARSRTSRSRWPKTPGTP